MQLESAFFSKIGKLFSLQCHRTTACHPLFSGMLESWHRAQEATIIALNDLDLIADLAFHFAWSPYTPPPPRKLYCQPC